MIMVKIRMWVCCVCVHDTKSIIAPPLPHSLGKTDSVLGTIASFVLQHIRLLQTVANIEYGTVSAKIAPRLKNASRLNRYNFPTDNAIDFLFSTLHTTPFHYEVLKIGSR